jgi:hypothetical protein
MSDCIFCTVPDIIYKNTAIYNVGVPVIVEDAACKTINIVTTQLKTNIDLSKATIFTPRSRLVLSLEDANRLIKHREAWLLHSKSTSPHAIIAESLLTSLIGRQLESMKLPKDWDIIKITTTDYVLTQRAAKVLILATQQYHDNVTDLIDTLSMLKVLQLRN